MKKLILPILMCIGFIASTNAQSYGPLEFDIVRLGYAIPSGDLDGGIAFGAAIRYNMKDNISIGLKSDWVIFGGGNDDTVDLGLARGTVVTGDYYFNTTSDKRPFAGIGLGTFTGVSTTFNDPVTGEEITGDAGSGIGIVPRVGYELGLLRLSAEYNLVFTDAVSNYIGIHLGFTIGGRYKG